MTCDELRAAAPELALDQLTGAERAVALHHLASCTSCRTLVTDLAAIADSVLLLAPEIEPPSGFESRVLARLEVAPVVPIRRRPWVAGIAAAAAVIGGIVGAVLADGDARPGMPRVAALVNASGVSVGNVVLADDPDRMTCTFEAERFGGAYAVEVVLSDGMVVDVGEFRSEGAPWSWTVPIDVRAEDVVVVRVLDGEGDVWSTAEVD